MGTQHQRVEDRRADLVASMRASDGAEFLLHVEIANGNAANMPLQMLRYYTDTRFAGHPGPIRQFLIYIGADRLTMPAGLDEPELLDYRYDLVDMHQIDCAGLLEQNNPDALVLAVLCDFGDRKLQEVVTHIVHYRAPLTRVAGCKRAGVPRLHEYAGDPVGKPGSGGTHGSGGRRRGSGARQALMQVPVNRSKDYPKWQTHRLVSWPSWSSGAT